MKALFQELSRSLRSGESLVLATIASKTGSAPRSGGSKMIIRADGSILGSVGGGRLEADTLRGAAEVFRTRRAVLLTFDLSGAEAAETGMLCGGRVQVLLEHVDAGVRVNVELFEALATMLEQGGSGWLLTAFDDPGRRAGISVLHCLVRPDGSSVGEIPGVTPILRRLMSESGERTTHVETVGERLLLVERFRNRGRVLVFGAGHCSRSLVPLAESVGFRVVVLDDREEFASRAHFPEPTDLVLLETFERLPDLSVDEDCYIVIVTRGHVHDRVVLEQSLRTQAGYIGMIGSLTKRDKVYAALLQQGFTKSDLDRVHSPIGVAILAETPEEIAISIVGELVKVRAERELGGGSASA